MLRYMTGDLLQSDAQALVNTVNCEGYMGKGIAYQFKLQYPANNADYVRACRQGELRPGRLHYYNEGGKTIINFPTKDKWRERSKITYIEDGLDALNVLVPELRLKSVAIPPLGSGNGGLKWPEVREVVRQKLDDLSQMIDVFIYEPSGGTRNNGTEPRLGVPALVLMTIKQRLQRFNAIRLQKSAYFMEVLSRAGIFQFASSLSGPYDPAIDRISRKIRAFQQYHSVTSTDDARRILLGRLTSRSVDALLDRIAPAIEQACSLVDAVPSDRELGQLAAAYEQIEKQDAMGQVTAVQKSRPLSTEMEDPSEMPADARLQLLYNAGILRKTRAGFAPAGDISRDV